MSVSAGKDAYHFGSCCFYFTDGRDTRCRFGTYLRQCAEVTAAEMRALHLVRLENFAQCMGNGIK